MIKLIIDEEFLDNEELVNTLEEITRLIKNGNTSGVYPSWEITRI